MTSVDFYRLLYFCSWLHLKTVFLTAPSPPPSVIHCLKLKVEEIYEGRNEYLSEEAWTKSGIGALLHPCWLTMYVWSRVSNPLSSSFAAYGTYAYQTERPAYWIFSMNTRTPYEVISSLAKGPLDLTSTFPWQRGDFSRCCPAMTASLRYWDSTFGFRKNFQSEGKVVRKGGACKGFGM